MVVGEVELVCWYASDMQSSNQTLVHERHRSFMFGEVELVH